MNTIQFTEIFKSLQGEGRWVGVPSVFLRTFGCNFRCRDFGCKTATQSTHNPEVFKIIQNLDQYQKFSDLPLVKTGCDSYASVYPEFRKFAKKATVVDLAEELLHEAGGTWNPSTGNDIHLVVTGGEPLLGWQRSYPELFGILADQGLKNITFETNGTQRLSPELKEFIQNSELTFTFMVSPKLSVSGESRALAIQPDIIADYELWGFTYLKFVVDQIPHFDEVDAAVADYRAGGFQGQVYVMPVGGTGSSYRKNSLPVAEAALARGYYFSPRIQCDLWKNAWGR